MIDMYENSYKHNDSKISFDQHCTTKYLGDGPGVMVRIHASQAEYPRRKE